MGAHTSFVFFLILKFWRFVFSQIHNKKTKISQFLCQKWQNIGGWCLFRWVGIKSKHWWVSAFFLVIYSQNVAIKIKSAKMM
jgi:hypothetical protein